MAKKIITKKKKRKKERKKTIERMREKSSKNV